MPKQGINNKGFTFVEIMVVLALVVLTSSIAMVNLFASRRSVEYNVCINNRAVVEHAEASYYIHTKKHTKAISDLLDLEYVSKVPICPSGGIYAWVPYDADDPAYQTIVGCSFHTGLSIEKEISKKETRSERKARLKAERKAARAAKKAERKAARAAKKAAKESAKKK